jgi:hypothetical protein
VPKQGVRQHDENDSSDRVEGSVGQPQDPQQADVLLHATPAVSCFNPADNLFAAPIAKLLTRY